ncbi:hypothetical protein AB205_0035040 [Aquarana catesbeiana]|uniref:Uncharacterized protein n=1 Tax=Aquarana catesbeiana TaxID=8400 RepID=A0A2G9NPZ7_AQUCT|nr:hypothetical protein AB205_0035040 [Aquarana catesbeiana]
MPTLRSKMIQMKLPQTGPQLHQTTLLYLQPLLQNDRIFRQLCVTVCMQGKFGPTFVGKNPWILLSECPNNVRPCVRGIKIRRRSVQHSTTRVSTSPSNTSPQTRSSTFAVTNTTSQPTPPGLSSANTTSSNTTNVERDWQSTVPIGGTAKALFSTASKSSTAGFFLICFTAFIVLF